MDRAVHACGLPVAVADCRPAVTAVRTARIDNTARDSVPDPGHAALGV
ncbi:MULTISPECIES: hypothetical protein [Streptomyces]|nr:MULTISPECIES: hypothetical protein [Streptomyces]